MSDDPSSLGDLVIELGYCTRHQVQAGLAAMNGKTKLGEVLYGMGCLTKHQLEWAQICQGMERKQVDRVQVHAFIRQQHSSLVEDLQSVTKGLRDLTAKINGKS